MAELQTLSADDAIPCEMMSGETTRIDQAALTGLIEKSEGIAIGTPNQGLPKLATGSDRVPVIATGSDRVPRIAAGSDRIPVIAAGADRIPLDAPNLGRTPVVATGSELIPVIAMGRGSSREFEVEEAPVSVDVVVSPVEPLEANAASTAAPTERVSRVRDMLIGGGLSIAAMIAWYCATQL